MRTRTFVVIALTTASLITPAMHRDDGPRASASSSGRERHGFSSPPSWEKAALEEVRRSEYHFTLGDDGAWSAPNRAHALRIRLAEDGLTITPRGPKRAASAEEWELRLKLIAHGREGALEAVESPWPQSSRNRAEFLHHTIDEWYVNDASGLEQGFTLPRPPEGGSPEAPVVLEMDIGGEVLALLGENERSVIFSSPAGAPVLTYAGLRVVDARGADLPSGLRIEGRRLLIVIDDRLASYPLVVDPLMSSASWTAESDQADAHFGFDVAAAGDVNGDGYSDVIVTAHLYDGGQMDEGRAFVYHGSPAGLPVSPQWIGEIDQPFATFGVSAGAAGDVDGDGYGDVIIGSFLEAVYVYLGSASGLATTPAWTADSGAAARFGIAVGTAGDVNGDGYDDVIVGADQYDNGQSNEGGAFVWLGGPSGLGANGTPGNADWSAESNQDAARFGISVATAGDTNGDGYGDVVVGSDTHDNGQTDEGRAFVYLGSISGLAPMPVRTFESNQAIARFGHSVASAGDVNGDGYSDIIVGAEFWDNDQTDEGRAFLYLGSGIGPNGPAVWPVEGNQASATFGWSVSGAGDVNGDGYGDVIVGANQFTNGQVFEGRAFVYHGSPAGLASTPAWTAEGDQDNAHYGGSVSGAGDINGDGFSDALVGATDYDHGEMEEGRAFLYLGSSIGLSASSAWLAEGDQFGSQFGSAVATAGDVNGDGYSDVIVGAPYYDNGQIDEGRAFLYLGSGTGLATVAAWSAEGGQDGALFGISVATAGDVNGDGFSDVIVGAEGFGAGQTYRGRALLYMGSATGLATAPGWIVDSSQDGAAFGGSIAAGGDVNGDGFGDVLVGARGFSNPQSSEGGTFLYLGSASGLATTPAWIAEGNQDGAVFGGSVATAGDVNRDGYSDVVVGAFGFDNGQLDEGRAFVWLGGPTGLGANGTPVNADWSAESNQASSFLGNSVATAGDVNRDGFSDVIIGAYSYDNGEADEGRAFVWLGGPVGLGATGTPINADWSAESNQGSSFFGFSVAAAGDVNGDGYGDVIIGAYRYDNGQQDEGGAFLYLGSATGPATSAASIAERNQVGAQFGLSVATAGDVNGDGYSDVIGGAIFQQPSPWIDHAALYAGNGAYGRPLAPRQMQRDGTTPIGPLGWSQASRSVRLRMIGRNSMGRGRLALEWEIKPLAVPMNGTGLQRTAFVDSGPPGGMGFGFLQVVSGLTNGTPYHWRARIVTTSPLAPRSPWVSPPFNGRNELDFWSGSCLDGDDDGYGSTGVCLGTDCDDSDANTHPGAPETNDGRDNQCPGDFGFGSIDEISVSGFPNPANPSSFCWSQLGATSYEVALSDDRTFATCIDKVIVTSICWNSTAIPPPGRVYYYLVRALTPFAGSWGRNSSGVERMPCP